MASLVPSGPVYISSHSADVVLSDIRPVRLALDALACLNAVLDEILSTVVLSARSLSTDRLKAGLLRALTTPLGKEALLEAELELRAYWERTNGPTPPTEADVNGDGLNIRWAVELLRLKCVAYSTLNDTDEDANAERNLADRMGNGDIGCSIVSVAPAALYMTAILECICEHILSNVGRVATRDSTRTVASISDLFTALCEDDAMYALFKSLNIYDRIELLSNPPKPKRSKSVSTRKTHERNGSFSPSVQQEQPPSRKDSFHYHKSSESASGPSAFPSAQPSSGVSRSSLERVRGIKLFNKAHSRTPSDREVQPSIADAHAVPRKSEGAGGYEPAFFGKQSQSLSGHSDAHQSAASFEDEREQEFEDLVRSAGTMKMSLTPDRLRTMEAHRSRTAAAANNVAIGNGIQQTPDIGATPTRVHNPPSSVSTVPVQRTTSVRQKLSQRSIKEDDEPRDILPPHPSLTSPGPVKRKNVPPLSANGSIRTRSVSTSGAYPSKGGPPPTIPKVSAVPPSSASTRSHFTAAQSRNHNTMDEFGMPKKTRKIQRNRESLDLDDVMNGMDDDEAESTPKTPKSVRSPDSKPGAGGHISQSARDLISFLEEGPPEDPFSRPQPGPRVDSITSPKSGSKGSSRLQRMISKLSLSAEKEGQQTPSRSANGNGNGYASMPSTPSLRSPPMPVPVMPKPPRYNPAPTTLISPPESPTDNDVIPGMATSDRSRKISTRKAVPTTWNPPVAPPSATPSGMASSPYPSTSNVPPSVSAPASQASWVQPTPLKVVNGQLERMPVPSVEKKTDSPSPAAATSPVSPPPPRPERADRIAQSPPDVVLQSPPRKYSSARAGAGRPESANSERRSRKATLPPTEPAAPLPPALSEGLAHDMRRMLGKATSADECRLLVDMFMARAGLGVSPTPSVSDVKAPGKSAEQIIAPPALERELVELFLGERMHTQPLVPVAQHAHEEDARVYHTPRQSHEEASTASEKPAAASRAHSATDTPRAGGVAPAVSPSIPIAA